MRVLQRPSELEAAGRPVCVAIGMFDGVHLGHQHVIRQAVLDAGHLSGLAVVVTFDPHPLQVVAPGRAPPLLQSLRQRLRALGTTGVHATLVIQFDSAVSQLTGTQFIAELTGGLPTLRSLSVGEGFQFGHRRSGDVALLQALGLQHPFRTHTLAPIAIGGEMVSSTRIRELLRQGELDRAAELLGRQYTLAGTVVRGDQLGRRLGFPTANLDVAGRALPPTGVYAGRTQLDGRPYAVALNLGYRPSLNEVEPILHTEAHILDFEGDLYGSELEVEIMERLRAETRFPNLDALTAQITRDVADVRRLVPV